jgi:hypothetical protein
VPQGGGEGGGISVIKGKSEEGAKRDWNRLQEVDRAGDMSCSSYVTLLLFQN